MFPRGKPKVLWVGRFDWQKRPDILLEVATILDDTEFQVYRYPGIDPMTDVIRKLWRLRNMQMTGEYVTFDNIMRSDSVALMYTSESDDMPNVLLEAGTLGLPITTACDRGISELVDSSTKYIVKKKKTNISYTKKQKSF